MTLLFFTTACAHKAPLKTPREIAKEEQKKQAKEVKEAARKAKKDAESQEVTVPEMPN